MTTHEIPSSEHRAEPPRDDQNSVSERRVAPRAGLSVPCCIRPEGRVRATVGRTRNVSLSGALVQLPPGGPELAEGDEVHLTLVPPATGLVETSELKPATVVRVSDSIRGTSCVAVRWGIEAVPTLISDLGSAA